MLARCGFQIRAAKQFQNDGHLALRRPTPAAGGRRFWSLRRVGTAGCPAAPLTEPDLRASHPALWIDVSPCQLELAGNLRKRIGHAPAVIERTELTMKPSVRVCLRH